MPTPITTYLKAEDGNYTTEHDSHKAAWDYVLHQMGDTPEPYHGGWIDGWGRQIWIERGDETLPKYTEGETT